MLTENHDAYLPDRIDATDKLWHQLCAMLPTSPHEEYIYWAPLGDEEILSHDAASIYLLADFFDNLYGMGTTVTGYYDPDDDRRNNEVNERTGYYYCSNV